MKRVGIALASLPPTMPIDENVKPLHVRKIKKNNTLLDHHSPGKTVEKPWISIDPKMPMSELVLNYPELIEPLTYDYGLHCVNCMISDFDTLEEGAIIHGIEGEELSEMIKDLEEIINSEKEDED